ncbi:MAG: hypothetical protein PHQ11_14555 [Paludibacter sp.]|nr:hypothetical protein [Paludibacter sp.]
MSRKILSSYKEEYDYSLVDSLNLSIAAGIGMFIFADKHGLI